jgi:hypothetical protein
MTLNGWKSSGRARDLAYRRGGELSVSRGPPELEKIRNFYVLVQSSLKSLRSE